MKIYKHQGYERMFLTSLLLSAELTLISNVMSRYGSKVSETPLQFKHLTEIKENMNSKFLPYRLLIGQNTFFPNKELRVLSEKDVSKFSHCG